MTAVQPPAWVRAELAEPGRRGARKAGRRGLRAVPGGPRVPRGDEWAGVVTEDEDEPSALGQVLTRTELKTLPKPEPLIEGWLDLRTTAVLIGATGTDKTFTLIGWACSIATGQPWLGNAVHTPVVRGVSQGYKVVLVLGEGAGGLDGRIAAWEEDNGCDVPDEMLTIMRMPPSIMAGQFWEELEAYCFAHDVRFVAFDTFSSLAPEADETTDAARVIRAMERLAVAIEGTVVLAHHSGWSDKLRARGGSQLEANPDTVVVASKTDEEDEDAPVRLWLKKDKEGPAGRRIWVARRPVGSSCVLGLCSEPAAGSGPGGHAAEALELALMGAAYRDRSPARLSYREFLSVVPGTAKAKGKAISAAVDGGLVTKTATGAGKTTWYSMAPVKDRISDGGA